MRKASLCVEAFSGLHVSAARLQQNIAKKKKKKDETSNCANYAVYIMMLSADVLINVRCLNQMNR